MDQQPQPETSHEIQLELAFENDHKTIPDSWTVPAVTCGRLGYCYCPKCNPR